MQLWFCLAVLAGLGLARAGWLPNRTLLLMGVLAVILTVRQKSFLTILSLLIVGLTFGELRGSAYMQRLADYRSLQGQKVTLHLQATTDGVYGTNSQISFDANHVVLDGTKLAGTVRVSGFGLNAVFQGDDVQVVGKLRQGSGQYQAFLSYGQLTFLHHHPSMISELRRRFVAGVQSSLPEPQASFALGLLIGQRSTLPASVKQDILAVGLTHIIAVSGYNLTIMLQASQRLLGRHSKRLSTLIAGLLLASFLLLAGASASIVRAAVVSVLSIWAGYYGRHFKPANLILLAAALTAWASPFYLWSDTGWYLSFLAFYGVLVVAPLMVTGFHRAWQRQLLGGVALESICAELMTIPLILFIFGQISLIGLPANLLVASLIPLAMLLCVIAGLAGMFVTGVVGWLAWPANILLTYMLDTAHVLAHIPGVFRQHLALAWWQMVACYTVVPVVTLMLTHRANHVKITDKNQVMQPGVTNVRTFEMVND